MPIGFGGLTSATCVRSSKNRSLNSEIGFSCATDGSTADCVERDPFLALLAESRRLRRSSLIHTESPDRVRPAMTSRQKAIGGPSASYWQVTADDEISRSDGSVVRSATSLLDGENLCASFGSDRVAPSLASTLRRRIKPRRRAARR